MAMPTSAAASAGASFTPSPAMATTRPSLRSFSTTALFCVRQHLGLHLGDAEPPGDGLRRRAVVAGQHDDADSFPRQRLQRGRRRLLDRVGDGEDGRCLAVDREEDGGGAVLAQPLGLAVERGRVDAVLAQEAGIAQRELAALDRAQHALAGRRVETRDIGQRELALARPPRRWPGQADVRSLSPALAASRSTSPSAKPGAATIATTLGLPSVSVPVLSTTRVSILLHPLQRLGVPDQHARLRTAADADHDRHRRRQAERAGAGDDQHRHRRHQRRTPAAARARRRPTPRRPRSRWQ